MAGFPELNDILNRFFDAKIAGIHTAMPGEIVEYDPATQKAIVQPLIKKKYADGESLSMPTISNVPVIWPRAGTASLTFPMAAGDGVLLVFAERSLDKWLSIGGEQEPGDSTKFNLSDAIAISGLYSFNNQSLDPDGTNVTLVFGDAKITITPDGEIILDNESTITMKANGEIEITNGNGAMKIGSDNKVAFGSSTDELLDLIYDLWTELISHDHGGQPVPPLNFAAMTALQTRLNAIKGTL